MEGDTVPSQFSVCTPVRGPYALLTVASWWPVNTGQCWIAWRLQLEVPTWPSSDQSSEFQGFLSYTKTYYAFSLIYLKKKSWYISRSRMQSKANRSLDTALPLLPPGPLQKQHTGFKLVWGLLIIPLLFPAAAKSLQVCLALCDPIDGSPSGSPVPGILQPRTLEWVAISFSSAWKWKVKVKSLSRVRLLATPWTTAYQAPLSMGFSRQEYWSGMPLPSLLLLPRKGNSRDPRCL